MFETGTLISRANVLFNDVDRLSLEYRESKAKLVAACLADVKKDIEEEKARLYHITAYRCSGSEDLTRSICILNGLLPLVTLSELAVKGELRAYRVVYRNDGDLYEIYTGYSLEEARKAVKNDTYEIRIYKPWKPIELMDRNDLEELFDEDGQFGEYEIYKDKEAKA